GIQASVARTVWITEHGDLAFESENRAVHIRLAENHASIVHQIARRKIIRAIHDDVVILEKIERILAAQMRFIRVDLNFRIQISQAVGGRRNFRPAHIAGSEENLALKVREIYGIKIHQADAAHSRSRQIESQRRAQAARSDAKHLGLLQLQLTVHAHFGHDQVPAVAQNLLFRKTRALCSWNLRFRRHKNSPYL